jgi:hypothetical protein
MKIKLAEYNFISKIKKESNKVYLGVVILFLMLALVVNYATFYFYGNPFILNFMVVIVFIYFLFSKKKMLNEKYHSNSEYWGEPYNEEIEGIKYQVIRRYEHCNSDGLIMDVEQRYFLNGLLSLHNNPAITKGFFSNQIETENIYWLNGISINSLSELKQIFKREQNLKNFS